MFEHNLNKRFLLVGFFPKGFSDDRIMPHLEELDSLVKTYGGETVAVSIQRGFQPSRVTYVGSGKAQEIAEKVAAEKIEVVVLNDILKSGQLYTLEKIWQRGNLQIKVWDKVGLILHIFDLHADTAESKLQIKLASFRHMGPRIYGMGYVLSRQGGGIGTRGIGETNTEIMKRHWRNEIRMIKGKLAKIVKDHETHIGKRKKSGTLSVSLVGYTNSGKTSLYNALTGKNKLVEDKLFATLDSSLGRLYLPEINHPVLLSDTIGFISQLPPLLFDSFKSTLMESLNSDLILHVIDISDQYIDSKIKVVEDILRQDLKLENRRQINVFNKTDKVSLEIIKIFKNKYPEEKTCFVSSVKGQGLDILKQRITQELKELL